MIRKISVLTLAVFVMAAVSPAFAAVVSVNWMEVPTTPEQIGDGAPVGFSLMVFADTDADILSINQVLVDATNPAYLNALGNETTPPNPVFVAAFPALGATSYITTPGATGLLGAGLPGDGTGSYGDLTNDGAQANFQIAQLTFPAGTIGTFDFRVSLAGTVGPEATSFQVPIGIPEPGSIALASMGLIGLVSMRRRRSC